MSEEFDVPSASLGKDQSASQQGRRTVLTHGKAIDAIIEKLHNHKGWDYRDDAIVLIENLAAERDLVCDRYFAVAQALGKEEATPDLAKLVGRLVEDLEEAVSGLAAMSDEMQEWKKRAEMAEEEWSNWDSRAMELESQVSALTVGNKHLQQERETWRGVAEMFRGQLSKRIYVMTENGAVLQRCEYCAEIEDLRDNPPEQEPEQIGDAEALAQANTVIRGQARQMVELYEEVGGLRGALEQCQMWAAGEMRFAVNEDPDHPDNQPDLYDRLDAVFRIAKAAQAQSENTAKMSEAKDVTP